MTSLETAAVRYVEARRRFAGKVDRTEEREALNDAWDALCMKVDDLSRLDVS